MQDPQDRKSLVARGQGKTYTPMQVRDDLGFNDQDSSQGIREGRCEKHFGTRTDMTQGQAEGRWKREDLD